MEIIERNKEIEEVKLMPPLVWAYIGDCIYEMHIRMNLVNNTRLHPHELHLQTTKYVKAVSQAETLDKIMEELTEDEKNIVRRGRNAQNHHLPKNVNLADYKKATAFESLIGYLYLTKQDERLIQILKISVSMIFENVPKNFKHKP